MALRIAINGFGRIGRLVFRAGFKDPRFEFVVMNDITDAKTLAHLLKYDSTHGRFPGKVEVAADGFLVDGKKLKVLAEKDPTKLPWKALNIDIVVESTGAKSFRDRKGVQQHIDAGAKKVLLTVPSKDEIDATIVCGVNDHDLKPEHKLVSNASCTTNCVAPMAKILHENFGIEWAFMTTIHSFTNDQNVLDAPHSDLRRARTAAHSIIPTTTGAARTVGKIMKDLKGKIDGTALRVPTVDGSITDLVVIAQKDVTIEAINAAFKKAADGPMKGVLEYTEDEIVSCDIIGNPHSCIFDAKSTMVLGPRMLKVFGWYDNEWGYSCRCIDLLHKMGV
ncbi:type I glyceraldehyde-3-phosphate dehydrogenase [candidate division KSB1 bacterium]|nr:MAG: type I glyceraldehyde-3-phosphate dehydrogenase [candidate division KSB1 bacterium]